MLQSLHAVLQWCCCPIRIGRGDRTPCRTASRRGEDVGNNSRQDPLCAQGGRSRLPRRRSNADVRPGAAVAAQMSAKGGNRPVRFRTRPVGYRTFGSRPGWPNPERPLTGGRFQVVRRLPSSRCGTTLSMLTTLTVRTTSTVWVVSRIAHQHSVDSKFDRPTNCRVLRVLTLSQRPHRCTSPTGLSHHEDAERVPWPWEVAAFDGITTPEDLPSPAYGFDGSSDYWLPRQRMANRSLRA